MDEFFKQYFGSLDTVVLAALGVILATAATHVVAFVCNLERWGPWLNPLFHADTDAVMPVVAALQGTVYGLMLGAEPGWRDNLRSGVVYGGASICMYLIVRKLLAAFGPGQGGKP